MALFRRPAPTVYGSPIRSASVPRATR